MRIAGVPERFITGDASDREKFDAWAATVPRIVGNPLHHWTALELKRYFDIDEALSPETAARIWDVCNDRHYSARELISNVECLCTSDRLTDDLSAHARLANFKTRVLPSVRDAETVDVERLDEFQRLGCRLADHAVDNFQTVLPQAREYARRGWVMQLHFGVERDTSTRLRNLVGPAGGYATIGNACDIPSLCRFLDGLDKEDCLPKVILYPMNPSDYAAIATLTGSFPGKVQFGPAWWYNDHALGIRHHLDTLASYGLLSKFVGMTTDSRSLLSMVRHEYFRRVLCDWLGDKVEAGELPADLGCLVRAVSYENARSWILGK
jgi:glucuronate isomerase